MVAPLDLNEEKRARQIAARAKLRERTVALQESTNADASSFESRPTTKEFVEITDGVKTRSRDREMDPAGPPWRRESTAEHQARQEKRAKKRKRLKDSAYDKTPEKLKNVSGLQVRVRTGAIYIAVTLICVLAGNIPTVLMLMVMAGICAGELYYMLRKDAKLPNEALGIIAAVMYPPAMYFGGLAAAMVVSLLLLLALLIWYVFWLRARISDVGVSFFGAAYTGLLLCGLIIVRQAVAAPWGGILVLLIFCSVWANDSFAYLIGSKFGKHKLAPRTSPKKSWEGFIAGLVGSVVIWIVITFVPGVNLSVPLSVLFGLICGCMGVLGDLVESRIKRNSGFKDSGTILPGHGGLLDRCDSLFLVSISAAILMVASGAIPTTFL